MYELLRSLIDTLELLCAPIHTEASGGVVQYWYELGKHQWLVTYVLGNDEPESIQLVGTTYSAFLSEYADDEARLSYETLTEAR